MRFFEESPARSPGEPFYTRHLGRVNFPLSSARNTSHIRDRKVSNRVIQLLVFRPAWPPKGISCVPRPRFLPFLWIETTDSAARNRGKAKDCECLYVVGYKTANSFTPKTPAVGEPKGVYWMSRNCLFCG